MDIQTLAFMLVLINVVQVIVLFLQYLTNKSYRGIGWWLLWSASSALGCTFMVLRNYLPLDLISLSIILTNIMLTSGQIFLYIGIMRFLDQKENRFIVAGFFTVFILSTFYVIYWNKNDEARVLVLYLTGALISFLAAKSLLLYKKNSIAASANFLLVIFLAHGCYFVFRAASFIYLPIDDVFTRTMMQTTTFLVQILSSVFWAFGLIIMINQRSNADISEAKEHFEMIFNNGPDAALITRLDDGYFVEINEGFEKLTGFTSSELMGKTILDVHVWKNPEDRHKVVAEIKRKGFCNNVEVISLHKNGNQHRGILSAKLINLNGTAHIISVVRDITDRMRTEEALRQSEEKFRLLVENSHDIIYSLTASGMFIFVSPAWTKLLGHPVSNVVGQSFQIFVHPDDLSGCMEFLQSVIETGKRQEGVEYRVRHADGRWFWHTSSAVPFTDDSGAITGFYGIARDISDRKKKEDDLKDLVASLQKALEEIKTLRGIVPICSSCKKIRDDKGYWEQVDAYVTRHTEAQFSHGICPECIKKFYPEYFD